jgi:hypothetical protein
LKIPRHKMEYSSLFQKSVCIFPFISFGIFGVKIFNISTINIIIRVEQLVSEHLSTQGRPNPKGGLHCFCAPNKTWKPPLGASDALIVLKNELETRKLRSPKVEGVKNSKKQTTEHYYKAGFLTPPKILCMLLCCYYSSKMICRTEGGTPIAF